MSHIITIPTGRISEIIFALKQIYKTDSIAQICLKKKLKFLCQIVQLSIDDLDAVISENPEVMRTIKGHVFESIFDQILKANNINFFEVGGDTSIDRIVNGKTLQLKTPNQGGTKGTIVQYKTHKTHGAKSAQESSEYYHRVDEFPDYLVGLVSYDPFQVVILSKNELPTCDDNPQYILSPFDINLNNYERLNNFQKIGIDDIDLTKYNFRVPLEKIEFECLSKSCQKLGRIKTEIIIDTILNEKNFRIWDMSIKGFARERAFKNFLENQKINFFPPSQYRRERADKSDLVILNSAKQPIFFQMKGLSINYCKFYGTQSIVSVETQLTRGRVNDHPTQSRLYLFSDFDFLIVAIDPILNQRYQRELGNEINLCWEFYSIPVRCLLPHHKYPNRVKAMQKINYTELLNYKIDEQWDLPSINRETQLVSGEILQTELFNTDEFID